MSDLLLVIPPGVGPLAPHHEAASGMGHLGPRNGAFFYAPHTAALCAAVARQSSLSVTVLDGTREDNPAEFARRVVSQPADVVALLISEGTRLSDDNFLRLLAHLAEGQAIPRRLLFGPSAHFVVDGWLAEGLAEAALTGEPEAAFATAVEGVTAGRLTGRVEAAALCPDRYRADGLLADLDALPFPAWDLVAWQPYGAAGLLSSRGCPARCTFCAYVVAQGRKFRHQSVERTLAEWVWLVREVKPPHIVFRDPVFAHDRQRVVDLCEGIVARGLRYRWMCESRPEHFDGELLKLMAAAGCYAVKLGMESGDPELLTALRRVDRPEQAAGYLAQVRRVVAHCRVLRIKPMVYVMAGLPGQTPASLAQTATALVELLPRTVVTAKPYQPHPGTKLTGPATAVSPAALAALQSVHRYVPGGVRRVWHALRRRGRRLLSKLRGPQPSRSGPAAPPAQPEPAAQPWLASLAGVRVFLTGGNGFVGGHVARALVEAGAQVVALVRPDSPLGQLADLPVDVVAGDLTRPGGWTAALAGCRVCFHVAALYAGAEQAEQMYAVNAGGTAALLAACAQAGVKRFVYTSTIGTVGRPAQEAVDGAAAPDESAAFNLWEHASPYVRSKFAGECIALSWQGAGLDVVVVKPTAPVGAGDARPSATGRRILAALTGEAIPYPAGGINHAPVRDIAAGHLLAALRGRPGACYILGHAAGNLDQAAFLRMVAAGAGATVVPPATASRQTTVALALTANPARAVRELGLPQSELAAAFREEIDWYRAMAARWPAQREQRR
jgi:nucleoside-diphosphate-sugar epimerase